MSNLNFFDEGSPFLSHPLLTPDRTSREVDFVESQLALLVGSAILDVGCGFGRHAIELAKRGYHVTAVDPANTMIERGQADAEAAGVKVDFRCLSGNDLTFHDQFEGAIALFTTIGQLSNENGESTQALGSIFEALKTGGRLIVEVPQLETAVKNLKPNDQFGDETQGTRIQRTFDPKTEIVTEQFELYSNGPSRHFLLKYRLFTHQTLTQLVEKSGFVVEASFGGYDQSSLQEGSPIMIVVGKK